MLINCPKCGTPNWLENEKQCHICSAVLRRCADCANFNRAEAKCKYLDYEVSTREAETPTRLSVSATCRFYSYFKVTA